jgi:enamine deaminase RidA (YjgF/YER057c/UK114 family)
MTDRQRVSSGSPYEPKIGFSRALPVDPDPEVQARRCLEIVVAALADAGVAPKHVVRTRIFITQSGYADAVSRAHGAVFGEVRPASTMVVIVGMLDPRWKVEIEADAVID